MLHHVPTAHDQNRIFAELARVVAPGGWVLLADSMPGEDLLAFHEGDTFNPIDPVSLVERLTAVGFAGIHVDTHDLGWCATAQVTAVSEPDGPSLGCVGRV